MMLLLSIFLSTFVLEDVALGAALALISQGQLSSITAFTLCCTGIALGDLGLYAIGRYASHIPYVRRKTESPKFKLLLENLLTGRKMTIAIVLSRAIPGTRLPTYFAAGFIKFSFSAFFFLTIVSVSIWVMTALYLGNAFFSLFAQNWLPALILFFLAFSLIKRILTLLRDPWLLKAKTQSWRKWLHFEFWPAWLFYLPIVPYYLFLSVRFKSLLLPFYACPHLKHGGLIGESKWDFLKHLKSPSPFTLETVLIQNPSKQIELLDELERREFYFPFVLKPDIGQRGYGVRIVKDKNEFLDYLAQMPGLILAQKKSQYLNEAGIFYLKNPDTQTGTIFSLTNKLFPFVVGNGRSRLGDLILSDTRARIIASTYFQRHKSNLNRVLPLNEVYMLSECGNHCQGAVFENGQHLITQQLLHSIESIVSRVPDFYFGRVDIRYKDAESLKRGTDFEIIEINGAGSEATHIWDSRTKLMEAYRVLFQQWTHLFSIGQYHKDRGLGPKPKLFVFIYDCLKVFFRKGSLTVSS